MNSMLRYWLQQGGEAHTSHISDYDRQRSEVNMGEGGISANAVNQILSELDKIQFDLKSTDQWHLLMVAYHRETGISVDQQKSRILELDSSVEGSLCCADYVLKAQRI